MKNFVTYVSALFLSIQTRLCSAKTVEFVFNVDIDDFMFKGKMIHAMAVNGSFGPPIHVTKGDQLIVHLTPSSAVRGISIHWHGFHMKGRQAYDGVTGVTMCPTASKTTFIYNFTVDEVPGSYWWHTHSHHSTYQWHDFVAGPLIVHEEDFPESVKLNPFAYENERVLFYMDMFQHNPQGNMLNSVGNMHPMISRGLAGDIVGTLPWWGGLLNGAESETAGTIIDVEPGQEYLFRVICGAGLYGFNFSIPGLTLKIVATDGAPLPNPIETDILFVWPAERFDIQLTIPLSMDGTTLSILAKTHENHEQGYDHSINGFIRVGAAAPSYVSPFISLPKSPRVFNCYKGQIEDGICNLFTETLSGNPVQETTWDYSPANTEVHYVDFLFNAPPQFVHLVRVDEGTWIQHNSPHYPMIGDDYPYQLHNNTVTLDLDINKTAIIILRTNARMHHPMHFHGMKFEVLEQLTIDQDEECHITACQFTDKYDSNDKLNELKNMPYSGVLKDTVVMPAGGAAVIRFPVDNPGAWIAHCHILLHLDDGMALILRQGTVESHRAIQMPKDMPVCPSEESVFIEPACDCYFDVDQLRFTQLQDDWRCSREYLCLHDTDVFPTPNYEPVYTQGIAMHELGESTAVVLPIIFSLMLLAAATFYTYNVYFKSDTPSLSEKASNKVEKTVVPFYSDFLNEFQTEWELRYRDAINLMRVFEVAGLATLTGVVFWSVGEDTSNRGLRETVSLLFFSTTLWTFTRMYPAIPAHHDWVKRMRSRVVVPESPSDPVALPPLIDVIKLSFSRSLVYFCAESWWPILFGIIVYPIAHVNGKVGIWFQHIGFLILNNLCYISFGSVIGTLAPGVSFGMISSTLYSQTSLVCAGFYRTLPSWLAWFRYISYVFYTFSGLVRGAYRWTDSYSCRTGDSRVGQEWCLLETAGVIEDMKLRGISVANSSDPGSADVSFDIGMLVMFYLSNVLIMGFALWSRLRTHRETVNADKLNKLNKLKPQHLEMSDMQTMSPMTVTVTKEMQSQL